MNIFLNFDFYGAGNIGDDLMLDGFTGSFRSGSEKIFCTVPRDSSCQNFRFPSVDFIDRSKRYSIAKSCPVWIGVGDTPVQTKSGDWFLMKLERDVENLSTTNSKWFMLGVGAESEAVSRKERYSRVLSHALRVWTRDEQSHDLLVNSFGMDPSKVKASADLANISLCGIFRNVNHSKIRKFSLGLCYYDENAGTESIGNITKFLRSISAQKKRSVFFANDVNEKGMFEHGLYGRIIPRGMRILPGRIRFFSPDYFSRTPLEKLVSHFSDYETVMTSRYHALLTAAWAGCKVISLERSSKVTALSRALGIAEVKKPYSLNDLTDAFEAARPVDREILNSMYMKARESIKELELAVTGPGSHSFKTSREEF
ncbi:MAG: polysaccharide pyruvyl transferase family protein [Ignavibacteria bacterium]|nr:polysaccharide pyruvyl transferase family protein [Ignavibacteria bacterium]